MGSLDNRKEVLLEKYWDGQTSLEEEKELKSLLTPDDGALYEFFGDVNSISSKEIDLDIPGIIEAADRSQQPARIFRMNNFLAYAASVILLVAAVFTYQQLDRSQPTYAMEETYEDPEEALEQTKEALAFVMSKMNKGQEQTMQNVKRIEALDVIIPK